MSAIEFPIRVRGKRLSPEQFECILTLVKQHPELSRRALSIKVCETMGWFQANGRPQDRACRDVLLQLHRRDLIELPPPRTQWAFNRKAIIPTSAGDAEPEMVYSLPELGSLNFEIVIGKEARKNGRESLWNELVDRYHFLKYRIVVGPSIKYLISARDRIIACMAFGGAAWKVAARDHWIGWAPDQRQARLPWIVDRQQCTVSDPAVDQVSQSGLPSSRPCG